MTTEMKNIAGTLEGLGITRKLGYQLYIRYIHREGNDAGVRTKLISERTYYRYCQFGNRGKPSVIKSIIDSLNYFFYAQNQEYINDIFLKIWGRRSDCRLLKNVHRRQEIKELVCFLLKNLEPAIRLDCALKVSDYLPL